MSKPEHRLADPQNVHAEPSRLAPELVHCWKGLPLEWLDAAPDVSTRDFHLPRPVLAMLERGRATAQFGFGNGRVVAHEFSADDLGLFVPGIEFKHSTGIARTCAES